MSWPPGEYCSKGTDRSRYSCGRQAGYGQCGSGSAGEPSRSRAGRAHTHVGGSHSEHAVQVLHQLLEGGPLRGRGVPALTHDHVPGGHSSRPSPTFPAPGPRDWPPPPQRRAHTHRSCVQLAGLSMRWPSFSSLKSSSTGMPGYGEPPSVKISQSRTPKDHLWVVGGTAASALEQTPLERRAHTRGLSPRPSQHLPPEAYAPPLAHAPAKSGATYTSLWWV